MVDTVKTTRYEQVKQILDRAAGDSTVDYDGQGRFWNLPLPRFLDVEVYGVRMIAPRETGPLPWGGQAVPEADISFISDWIDDGCPAADHQISFGVDGTVTETTLEELDESNVEPAARRYEVYEGSPNEYSYK